MFFRSYTHATQPTKTFQTGSKKRDAWPAGTFKDHTALGIELSDEAVQRAMPGDCTFASYCTSPKVLNHIQSTQRASVGALQLHRQVV
jgi:hypothetical protein